MAVPMPFWPLPFLGPELVYSDPPYLHATRRSARRYRFDYEEVDHVALLDLLKDLPCQVMVSGHPSALYDEMLADPWRSLAPGDDPGPCGPRRVVQLRARPGALGSYAGRNFTDRQRIRAANAGVTRPCRRANASQLAAMMAVARTRDAVALARGPRRP